MFVSCVSPIQTISWCLLAPRIPTGTVRCVKEPCRAELEGGVEKRALLDGLAACGAERQASRKARHRRMTNFQSGGRRVLLPVRASAKQAKQRVGWQSCGAFWRRRLLQLAGTTTASVVHLMIQRQERWNARTLEHSALYLLVQYRQQLLHGPEAGASVGCWPDQGKNALHHTFRALTPA
jgi:hypothetical protein